MHTISVTGFDTVDLVLGLRMRSDSCGIGSCALWEQIMVSGALEKVGLVQRYMVTIAACGICMVGSREAEDGGFEVYGWLQIDKMLR